MTSKRSAQAGKKTPLPHTELQILLQLAASACHGYEMMKAIAGQSRGQRAPGPGTLYVALRRLADSGLIRETAAVSGARSRRRYRLTAAGKRALADELERLDGLLKQAQDAGWEVSTGRFRS